MKDTISYLIASVCKKHRSLTDVLLQKECGLHVGQEMILNQLWIHDGLSQSELAEKMEVHQATLTKSIKRMEAQGFVRRNRDSEDKRISKVYLTSKGVNLNNVVHFTWKKVENRSINDFTPEELLTLRKLLLKVKNNLS